MPTQTLPSATLYNTQGGSDKVYIINIEASGTGFVVNYSNGRRGGTLQHGTKTKEPVDLPAAEKIFNKVVKEKVGGGYVVSGDAASRVVLPAAAVESFIPQLCNPITPEHAERLILDPAWCAQEKKNGECRTAKIEGGLIVGGNRKGKAVALPSVIVEALKGLDHDYQGGSGLCNKLHGEQIGDTFFVFDCLARKGHDLRNQPLSARLAYLENRTEESGFPVVSGVLEVVPTAYTTAEKRALYDRCRAEKREGVVFKRLDSAYSEGRPNSGGDWLKDKFTAMASCRVAAGRSDKRSVGLELIDKNGSWIGVGNVTIPPNCDVPAVGAVVEVEYLYAYEGGSLDLPVYQGLRTDIDPDECAVTQLKYKPEE